MTIASLDPDAADLFTPRARAGDPATSKAAAARAKYFAPSHRDRILGVLWRPATAAMIAQLTGLTVVQVDRRMPELEAAGEARVTGVVRDGMREWERVLTPTGSQG